MASDDPVLPPVYSTTRMPGSRAPRVSAPSIIASAILSLYDPVGLKYSSFTNTSAARGGTMCFNCTTGVCPIVFRMESETAAVDMAEGSRDTRLIQAGNRRSKLPPKIRAAASSSTPSS